MNPDILIIVILTAFIQSIFGVGVLLFGTPLLLLRSYAFIDAVMILLPISLSINLIQILKSYKLADWEFYKKILIYTIPFVVIFLFFVTQFAINITLFVGLFLLLVAAKDYSAKAKKVITFLIRYEKAYFMLMGVIHGLTNLGGSLLTAIVHGKGYEKTVTRVTIALAYASFALFQMATLLLAGHRFDFLHTGLYVLAGFTVFLLTELFIFIEINSRNYAKYFAVFLFLSGVLLCVKSI